MPIYEYLCNDCEAFFEIFFKSYGNTSGTKCPGCSSESVERKISSVSFKIDSSSNPLDRIIDASTPSKDVPLIVPIAI